GRPWASARTIASSRIRSRSGSRPVVSTSMTAKRGTSDGTPDGAVDGTPDEAVGGAGGDAATDTADDAEVRPRRRSSNPTRVPSGRAMLIRGSSQERLTDGRDDRGRS